MRRAGLFFGLLLAVLCLYSTPAPTVATTWDPAQCSAADTLSLGNTKITNNNSATGGCRSTVAKTTGKIYWECKVEFSGVSGCGAGNASASVSTIASTANMALCLESSSTMYVNGSSQGGGTCSAMVSGNWRRIAVDIDAAKIWIGDSSASTNWNGQTDGSQNPATGAGGYSIAGLTPTGGTYIYAELQQGTGEKATINPGPTFAATIPAGFTAFDLGGAGGAGQDLMTIRCCGN